MEISEGSEEARAASKPAEKFATRAIVYITFMFVGNGCGWFVANALWQTLANDPNVAQGGRMFGKVTIITGVVGLSVALLYVISLARGAMTLRTGQLLSSLLIASSVATFGLLALFWDVGAPVYPVYLLATVLGNITAASTFFVLFPLISTFYGGWLIAPVRAGTDVSSLVTSLLGEAQNPTGTENIFPMWVLYVAYMLLSAGGLVAWVLILRFGVGLREGAAEEELAEQKQHQQQVQQELQEEEGAGENPELVVAAEEGAAAAGKPEAHGARRRARRGALAAMLRHWLEELACPRCLLGPVVCAVISQVLQWSLVVPIAQIGAHMTDPEGCDGDLGKEAYRLSLTLASILVPVGSVLSSYAECPRWAFYTLSALQLVAAVAVVMALAGVGQQDFWFLPAGRAAYVGCVAAVAGLEGYLLTMAYRYIGDSKDFPQHLRLSASSLLSFLSIVAVNPAAITIGVLVDSGVIGCTE